MKPFLAKIKDAVATQAAGLLVLGCLTVLGIFGTALFGGSTLAWIGFGFVSGVAVGVAASALVVRARLRANARQQSAQQTWTSSFFSYERVLWRMSTASHPADRWHAEQSTSLAPEPYCPLCEARLVQPSNTSEVQRALAATLSDETLQCPICEQVFGFSDRVSNVHYRAMSAARASVASRVPVVGRDDGSR